MNIFEQIEDEMAKMVLKKQEPAVVYLGKKQMKEFAQSVSDMAIEDGEFISPEDVMMHEITIADDVKVIATKNEDELRIIAKNELLN